MKAVSSVVLLLLVSTALATFLFQTPKVSKILQQRLVAAARNGQKTIDVLVTFAPFDLKKYQAIEDIEERARYLVNDMIQHAELTQESIVKRLKAENVEFRSLWISNAIAIPECPISLVHWLSTHPLVTKVLSDASFKVKLPQSEHIGSDRAELLFSGNATVEWNIEWVKATKVWDEFNKHGEGITVGVADTGIHHLHPALVEKYRGNKGSGNFDHNYHWFDAIKKPIKSSPGRCGIDSKVPCDDYGHGTHCSGTVLGSTESRIVGVAPQAKLVGCRNMHSGEGRPSTYIDCLQFFMAPTDLAGKNPKPDLRPHIVSNSYGCDPSELCEHDSIKDAVDAITSAGVLMAVAAGNDGPSCSSVSDGPAIYESSFSVGALGSRTNNIASFSSRGPVTVDGSNRLKPEIAAPGTAVLSSVPPSGYASYSGTSMATPHIAGCVALLWSAAPSLKRNLKDTIGLIEKTAVQQSSTLCNSKGVPNNVYGYGNVDVFAAVKAAPK